MANDLIKHSIAVLVLITIGVSARNNACMWNRVYVSSLLLPSGLHLEHRDLPYFRTMSWSVVCSSTCCRIQWCNLWCRDPALNICLLSDLIVMPSYKEPNMADALLCFTSRHRDYVTGASIAAGESLKEDQTRTKENLVDGIYGYALSSCFASEYYTNPWFVVDLGSVRPIRFVKVIMQNNEYSIKHYDYQVRLGTEEATPEDFTSYKLFGVFDGPAVANQEVVFHSVSPVMARFVAVLRVSRNRSLQVCHLEVY